MIDAVPALNAERLWRRVEDLARFTDPGLPWTRRAFTPLFAQAREWLREEFARAGLSVTQDAGGNLVGRLEGRHAGAPALATGSHCDTVTMGGRFDGIIGVLAGIEIAHAWNENGRRLQRPFEVIDFLSEEPSDYGPSCIGSRALAGQLSGAMLAATNSSGETLAQGLRRIGADPDALAGPLRPRGAFDAFVELHIEQGPVLEAAAKQIGVVTDIVGIRRYAITVCGRADHSGTTPMHMRSDALAGAAQIVDATQRLASSLAHEGRQFVATIGKLDVLPNASNAVPASVQMTLESRSGDESLLDGFLDRVTEFATPRLQELRVATETREISRSRPTPCDARVQEAIRAAARDAGCTASSIASGAGHDAVYMAQLCPTGMIFIPCRGGRSHSADEWIEPRQLLDGARVLQRTLAILDSIPLPNLSPRSTP